jgi:hypothetical protein
MNTTLKIFAKVYIQTFYRENASFFLVIIGVAGGFMSSVEHIALAEFFLSSPSTSLIPVLLWTVYALKIVNHNATATRRKQNEFLFTHSLFPLGQQYRNVLFVLLNQLAPAFVYGGFLAVMAVKLDLWIQLSIISIGLLLILIATSVSLKYFLTNPDAEKKVGFVDRLLNKVFIRPYPGFIIEWLSRKKTFLLISVMAFCSLFLFGVLILYTTDSYDFRLLQMALVIVASGNVQLIQEIHSFETLHFSILQQQPLSFSKRICYLLPVFVFISLPQMALLLRYFPTNLNWLTLIECIAFMIGYPFFLYGLLYRRQINQEQFMRVAFGCALCMFVLALFGVPNWIITILAVATGLSIWKQNFYKYEVVNEVLKHHNKS